MNATDQYMSGTGLSCLFPPHLVRSYVERFGLSEGQTILDPFCGTGTTIVEAKKLGIGKCGNRSQCGGPFCRECENKLEY